MIKKIGMVFLTFFILDSIWAKTEYSVRIQAVCYKYVDKIIKVNGKCLRTETKQQCRIRRHCRWIRESGKRTRKCVIRKYACKNHDVCVLYEKVDSVVKALEMQPTEGYFHKIKKNGKDCFLYYKF